MAAGRSTVGIGSGSWRSSNGSSRNPGEEGVRSCLAVDGLSAVHRTNWEPRGIPPPLATIFRGRKIHDLGLPGRASVHRRRSIESASDASAGDAILSPRPFLLVPSRTVASTTPSGSPVLSTKETPFRKRDSPGPFRFIRGFDRSVWRGSSVRPPPRPYVVDSRTDLVHRSSYGLRIGPRPSRKGMPPHESCKSSARSSAGEGKPLKHLNSSIDYRSLTTEIGILNRPTPYLGRCTEIPSLSIPTGIDSSGTKGPRRGSHRRGRIHPSPYGRRHPSFPAEDSQRDPVRSGTVLADPRRGMS